MKPACSSPVSRSVTASRTPTSGTAKHGPRSVSPFDALSPRGTLTLYIHYDGQPVTASEWTRCKPFAPCLYGPTGEVPLSPTTVLNPDWRVYGRSVADDKGPIVAVLNASSGKNYIETVWGRGYVLRERSEDEHRIAA